MHGSLPGLAAGRFGVIMFFSACRLPSFAPEDPPSHASGNQITTGHARASSRGPGSGVCVVCARAGGTHGRDRRPRRRRRARMSGC